MKKLFHFKFLGIFKSTEGFQLFEGFENWTHHPLMERPNKRNKVLSSEVQFIQIVVEGQCEQEY